MTSIALLRQPRFHVLCGMPPEGSPQLEGSLLCHHCRYEYYLARAPGVWRLEVRWYRQHLIGTRFPALRRLLRANRVPLMCQPILEAFAAARPLPWTTSG